MKKLLYFIPFLFLSCADPDVDTLTLQSVYAEIEIINSSLFLKACPSLASPPETSYIQ